MGEADAGLGGEHLAGHDEDGADAAVRGGAQRDVHAELRAQPAHHGQAQARVLGEVLHVGAAFGLFEQALDAGAGLLAEADAGVLDLDAHAALHLGRGDVHLGGGRRVAGGVVEEFGRGVDDGFDRGALDVDLGDGGQVDPAVLQDPGHGTAQHAVEGDRFGPLASGPAAADDGDGVGEAADQRGAVVDAQEVVEDLGVAPVVLLHLAQFLVLLVDDRLDTAGDVDEGALGGLPHGVLVVDDLADHPDQLSLRLTEFGVRGVHLAEPVHHLAGRGAPAHEPQDVRDDLGPEADHLLVVARGPVVQVGGVTGVFGALGPQHAAAAHGFGGRGEHQEGGDGTAQADGGPGRFRHEGDGGPGDRGHHYDRQQQHARIGKFAATWRGINTHHVGLLKRVGGDGHACGGVGRGVSGSFGAWGTSARFHLNSVRCGRA